jgi:hypothetical protein
VCARQRFPQSERDPPPPLKLLGTECARRRRGTPPPQGLTLPPGPNPAPCAAAQGSPFACVARFVPRCLASMHGASHAILKQTLARRPLALAVPARRWLQQAAVVTSATTSLASRRRPLPGCQRSQGCGRFQPFGAASALRHSHCLELPPLQHRGGGRGAAARVRQPRPLVAAAPRGAVRAQRPHHRRLLLLWLPHWSRRAPTFPPHRTRFSPPDPRRVRALRLKLFPPEYVSIMYCTPAGCALRTRSTPSWCRARRGPGCSRGAATRAPTRSRPRASPRTTFASRRRPRACATRCSRRSARWRRPRPSGSRPLASMSGSRRQSSWEGLALDGSRGGL